MVGELNKKQCFDSPLLRIHSSIVDREKHFGHMRYSLKKCLFVYIAGSMQCLGKRTSKQN